MKKHVRALGIVLIVLYMFPSFCKAQVGVSLSFPFIDTYPFFLAPAILTGGGTRSVALGDFDNDGKVDVVTANYGAGSVSILKNDGYGGFYVALLGGVVEARADYAVGSTPSSVAVGDFDGDGHLDVVTANFQSNSISILTNNGSGGFEIVYLGSTHELRQDYTVGAAPESVSVGDFNNDGKLDIVVANLYSNTVSVLLNNGHGMFAKADYVVDDRPSSVAVGDFNSDGKLDIVTANSVSSTLSVLLNNGDGTFAAKTDYYGGYASYSVATGDFNGDGKLDLAVANYGYNTQSTVGILLNKGNGTFAPKVDYGQGPSGNFFVAVKDFNQDGKLDVVATNVLTGAMSILLNDGHGTFAPKVDYAVSNTCYSLAFYDFDGDGSPDILAADFKSNAFHIIYNKGDGTFKARKDYAVGSGPAAVITADFNGDGSPDLATANPISGTISILLNNGKGTFAPKVDYIVGYTTYSLAAGDFNGDGKMDIVETNVNAGTVGILLNNGDGTFAPKVDYPVGDSSTVAVGDFNGDGHLDVVTANNSLGTISIFLNNGNGTLAPKVDYAVGSGYYPRSLAVGDFNGDGMPDVVTANTGISTVSVLLNNGDGTFAPKVDYYITRSSGSLVPLSIAVGDFDKDGFLDIVTANELTNTVSILHNLGNGVFSSFGTEGLTEVEAGSQPHSVAVGDFNGDGYPDLVIGNYPNDTMRILINMGCGNFVQNVDYVVGSDQSSVAVADFNGDAVPDIVTANQSVNTVSVVFNVSDLVRVVGSLSLEGIVAPAMAQPIHFLSIAQGPGISYAWCVAPSGEFVVTLPKRKGRLVIKGDKYLSQAINLDTTGGDISDLNVFLPAGDVNNDNYCDIDDLGALAFVFGSVSGDHRFNAQADLNGDNKVDLDDLVLLANNYGMQGDL